MSDLREKARKWLYDRSTVDGHIYDALPAEGSEHAAFEEMLGSSDLDSLTALLRAVAAEAVEQLQEQASAEFLEGAEAGAKMLEDARREGFRAGQAAGPNSSPEPTPPIETA